MGRSAARGTKRVPRRLGSGSPWMTWAWSSTSTSVSSGCSDFISRATGWSVNSGKSDRRASLPDRARLRACTKSRVSISWVSAWRVLRSETVPTASTAAVRRAAAVRTMIQRMLSQRLRAGGPVVPESLGSDPGVAGAGITVSPTPLGGADAAAIVGSIAAAEDLTRAGLLLLRPLEVPRRPGVGAIHGQGSAPEARCLVQLAAGERLHPPREVLALQVVGDLEVMGVGRPDDLPEAEGVVRAALLHGRHAAPVEEFELLPGEGRAGGEAGRGLGGPHQQRFASRRSAG